MKQTVVTAYIFNPGVNQIDLSSIDGFTVERLYAIINITRNQLIYAVGQPTYGFVGVSGGVVTLAYNTSAMSDTDLLEIIYDTVNTDLSNAGVTMLTDGTHNQSYTAAGEAKVSVTEPLPAGTNNIGSITNITGTQTLPTNAAQESGGHLASIDSKLADDGSGNLKVNLETSIPAGSNTIGGVTQSGSWTVSLESESIEIGKVDQGTPNTLANAWPVTPTDGTHAITVKAASTPAASTDTAEVVALSPNTPLPSGSNILGAVTQSGGPWTSNVTQFGGSAVVTGVGASGAGIPRVTVSNDSNILATQSGAWSVAQSGSWNVGQSGTWNITNISGTISLPTGASTSALQTTGNGFLSAIEANQTNGTQISQVADASGRIIVIKPASTAAAAGDNSLVVALSPNSPLPAGSNILGSVSQNGTWTTARSWTLASGTDSVSAVQSGTWNITNISGTVSLPTGASTSALQTTGNTSLASILANQTNGTQETQVTNFPATQAVTQSGSWTVSLTSESIEIGKVDQGNAGTNAQAWWTQIGDTTHGPVAVKAASTAAAAADPSFVVAFSPNSPLPTGSNVLGSVSQNGSWTTGRTWTLASGTDSVAAVQSGTWNINNISGTISLPTGASTSALQSTGNTSLASILADMTNGTQLTQVVDASGHIVTIKPASTASATADTSLVVALSPNSPLPAGTNILGSVSQNGTWTVQQGGAPWSVSQSGSWTVAATQSGTWTTARSWTLASGTDSVSAVQSGNWSVRLQDGNGNAISSTTGSLNVDVTNTVPVSQSGTWNITNISGTISLPTGASTSALQTTGNTSLSSILANQTNGTQETQVTNFPATQAVTQSTSPWIVKDQADGPVAPGAAAAFSMLMGGVFNSAGVTLTNGQQSALQLSAAGEVLVTYNDDLFTTQSITTQDLVTTSAAGANGQLVYTGTPTAGSVATIGLTSDDGAVVQVSGTWTGSLQVEISMDGGTTWYARPLNQTGAFFVSALFTGNFTGGTNIAGYTNLRVRATAAMTGTAVVRFNTTNNTNMVYIGNAIKLMDSSGDVASIDATGHLTTSDIINVGSGYQAISVTGTAVAAVSSGSTPLANRKMLTVTPTNGTVYWGTNNSVTTSTGQPIFTNQTVSFAFGPNITVFLVSAGTVNTRVFEGS